MKYPFNKELFLDELISSVAVVFFLPFQSRGNSSVKTNHNLGFSQTRSPPKWAVAFCFPSTSQHQVALAKDMPICLWEMHMSKSSPMFQVKQNGAEAFMPWQKELQTGKGANLLNDMDMLRPHMPCKNNIRKVFCSCRTEEASIDSPHTFTALSIWVWVKIKLFVSID